MRVMSEKNEYLLNKCLIPGGWCKSENSHELCCWSCFQQLLCVEA